MEIWKPIKDYEGFYEASNIGRVRSLDRGKNKKGIILKQVINEAGYKQVGLCKKNKQKTVHIHRLVAITFLDNPDNLPQVGHMDDDKQNNNINNLYWTDAKENNTHNGVNLRSANTRSIKIKGTLNDTVVIFKSLAEAGRNGFSQSAISNCLRGGIKTHKKYKWEIIHERI